MEIQTLAGTPRNERGGGQVSYLLLGAGQLGARQMCVTWVECQPGSQQALHVHPAQEQAYVIVRGRGRMLAGSDEREVSEGTLVFVPPGTQHAIFNNGPGVLVYVSATAPPFGAEVSGGTWHPSDLAPSDLPAQDLPAPDLPAQDLPAQDLRAQAPQDRPTQDLRTQDPA